MLADFSKQKMRLHPADELFIVNYLLSSNNYSREKLINVTANTLILIIKRLIIEISLKKRFLNGRKNETWSRKIGSFSLNKIYTCE